MRAAGCASSVERLKYNWRTGALAQTPENAGCAPLRPGSVARIGGGAKSILEELADWHSR
jgi:hypothetical protein